MKLKWEKLKQKYSYTVKRKNEKTAGTGEIEPLEKKKTKKKKSTR